MRAVLLSVLLLAAGCLDNVPFFGSDEEATMGEVRPAAQDAARAWNAQAQLLSAFAWESREPSDGMGFDPRLPPDPAPGNGKAAAWAFNFRAGDAEATFIVAANGTVVDRDLENDAGDDDESPLGEIRVDSDEAMEAARRNATFDAAVEEARGSGMAVSRNASAATWALFAVGPRTVIALVDADSGELRGVFSMGDWAKGWSRAWWSGGSGSGNWSGSWNWSGWGSWGGGRVVYEDERSGTVTRAEPTAEEAFPVEGSEVVLHLVYDKRLPADEVGLALVGPGGAEVEGECEEGSVTVGRPSRECAFERLDRGEHVARLTLDGTSVAVDYDLTIRVFA